MGLGVAFSGQYRRTEICFLLQVIAAVNYMGLKGSTFWAVPPYTMTSSAARNCHSKLMDLGDAFYGQHKDRVDRDVFSCKKCYSKVMGLKVVYSGKHHRTQ